MKQNVAVRVEQELDRAGADVADGARQPRPRTSPMRSAQRRRRRPGEGASSMSFWWRRCTEQSRSPRWMHVAVRVGEDLHLDVARPQQRALQQQLAGRRTRTRPRARARASAAASCRPRVDQPHAAPAAAGRGLDHQRKADALRLGAQALVRLVRAVVARQARARRAPAPAAWPRDLSPSARIAAGGGPTHDQAGVAAPPRRSRRSRSGSRSPDGPRRRRGLRARRRSACRCAGRNRPARSPPSATDAVGLAHVQARRGRRRNTPRPSAMPRRCAVRMMRAAISPRLATSSATDHQPSLRARGSLAMPMSLAMMPSITSSAPPPIEPSRPSR